MAPKHEAPASSSLAGASVYWRALEDVNLARDQPFRRLTRTP